ncbi:LysR family transcriptional regulator [Nocardia beijingensis]|uniref:helix-turn-helix domain-containing protein n=1 Tax=Nocardia beijingensis TaxID=95162 RepID=UPI0033CBDCD1
MRQFEYILAVWESGSLSAAAARLNVSQPSLSQQMPPSTVRWHALFPTAVLRVHDFSHRRALEDAVRSRQGDIAVGPTGATVSRPAHLPRVSAHRRGGPSGRGAALSASRPSQLEVRWSGLSARRWRRVRRPRISRWTSGRTMPNRGAMP